MNNIFESVDDFIAYVPNVAGSISWEKVDVNCKTAMNKFIVPILGVDILASLDEDVISNLKNCVANFAVYEIMQIANINITDSSASYNDSDNLKANFGEKQDALNAFSSNGDLYLEKLIILAQEKNIEISSKVSSVFFRNLKEFEAHRFLANSNRTFIALQPIISLIENMDILPRLGNVIDTIFEDAQYKKLLYFVRAYIASATLISAIPSMKVRYASGGVNVVSFIPNIEDKFNKSCQDSKIEVLEKEKEKISILLEKELNRIFASESIPYENLPTNKGFAF